MIKLIALPIVFVVLALCVFLEGLCLSILWGWFVAPTFGLPEITIPIAIGLALVVSCTRSPHIHSDDKEVAIERSIAAVITPLFFLLIGFIVKVIFL